MAATAYTTTQPEPPACDWRLLYPKLAAELDNLARLQRDADALGLPAPAGA